MSPKEPIVTEATPMPKGYGFLRKGNPYLTANVRRKTNAANKKLYIVRNRNQNLGLRAPKRILKEVFDEERATREKRQNEVERRDSANEKEFESAIRTQFPNIPEDELQKVVKRALEKKSGRVGRTKLLGIDQKAKLAVTAHIRHCHTKYDTLVRGPISRQNARDVIQGDLTRVLAQWRGPQAAVSPRRQRKMDRRRARAPKHRDLPKKPKLQASHTNQAKQPQQKQHQPLPHKVGPGRSTRAYARSKRAGGGEKLEVLDVFFDDEEGEEDSKSSDESQEENEADPRGLYEENLDDLSDGSQEDSEDDFAEEWDSE